MKKVAVSPTEAFPLTQSQRLSFANAPTAYRISGPPGLVRLVQRGRSKVGSFWIEEPVFSRLRELAKRDLAQQAKANGEPFARPMKELAGMYMKHCLRSDLAICKDWTSDFDAFVVLPLRPIDSVVAWVGKIKNQPYYSKPAPTDPDYAARKRVHDQAETGGVRLLATQMQYVIHFDRPENRGLENRILGPWEF